MLEENENWFQVALTLRGDGVDLETVTETLGLEPTSWGLANGHRHVRRGAEVRPLMRSPLCKTNYWSHDATLDDGIPFKDQITPLVTHLEGRLGAVRLFAQSDVESELFLGFARCTGLGHIAWFSAELLGRISALGIEMAIDLFPPSASLALRKYERAQALRNGMNEPG